MPRTFFITLLTLIGVVNTASANLAEGMKALDRGDYRQSFANFKAEVDKGNNNPVLQHLLALHYFRGNGVKQDYAQAAKWHRKSAEQGFFKAQETLAYMYLDGLGLKKDTVNAVKWMQKAAEQGSVYAQNELAVWYMNGQGGIKKDLTKAKKWFEKAANQGDGLAQFNLGMMYYFGEGAEKNTRKAVQWLEKACGNGEQEACSTLRELNK